MSSSMNVSGESMRAQMSVRSEEAKVGFLGSSSRVAGEVEVAARMTAATTDMEKEDILEATSRRGEVRERGTAAAAVSAAAAVAVAAAAVPCCSQRDIGGKLEY